MRFADQFGGYEGGAVDGAFARAFGDVLEDAANDVGVVGGEEGFCGRRERVHGFWDYLPGYGVVDFAGEGKELAGLRVVAVRDFVGEAGGVKDGRLR